MILIKKKGEHNYENWPWRFRWTHWGQAKPFLFRTSARWLQAASAISAKPCFPYSDAATGTKKP